MAVVNRTERLYALVEELRAVSPRSRTAAWLAGRFEVSPRTVERDLDALRRSGVVIRGGVGRTGGYSLDRNRTMAPVTLTATEALAVSVALRAVAASPYADAARRASQKILAVLPADVRRREEALSGRIHRVGTHRRALVRDVSEVVEAATATGRVLDLAYTDRSGAQTSRAVEPMGLLWGPRGWYLMAWCRLRGAIRGFDLDRITTAGLTDEHAPPRPAELAAELARLDAEPLRS